MKVAVVGLGKLGAPLAAVVASKGHDVVGIDVNPQAVQRLNDGVAPVDEPGLQELVSRNRDRLSGTTDLLTAATADVSILLVPTPSGADGSFSNDFVLGAIEQVGTGLAEGDDYHVLVVASTVMPGSCEAKVVPLLERTSGRRVGESLGVCYSPEFIALGNVIANMLRPDMVLIGESDSRAGDVVERLYKSIVENDPPFRRINLINAELAKIAVNTYVTMKISYANTLADMCERLPGADVTEVTDALGLDSRIGPKYIRGAIAYGGPCFPRDTKAFAALARDIGVEPMLAEATDAVNLSRVEGLARLVQSRVEAGSTVGILGLAYKPGTGVIDESPGVGLARLLGSSGHEIYVYDPHPAAMRRGLEVLDGLAYGTASAEALLERSDAIVITTPWPEFATLMFQENGRGDGRPIAGDFSQVRPKRTSRSFASVGLCRR
jgi:UDPglucose 6-dehydrogenase